MSDEETSSILPDNQYGPTYGAVIQRSSTVNFDNLRPSTPQLHRIDTAPLLSQSILSTTTNQSLSDQTMSTISIWAKIGYGLGHVYNDLCAGVWFSYLLLFMKGAMRIPGTEAGGMMMLGQVGDALATPIVGFLVDRYGTKQKWHLFGKFECIFSFSNCVIELSFHFSHRSNFAGTLLVFVTFPMIFSICPMCDVWPTWWHIVYFSIVILIFQFGWPIVQVSHLAIIPEMARTQKDRTQLTSVRYSASVISNIIVFIVTWLVLRANRTTTDTKINPRDAYRFRVMRKIK